MTNKPSHLIHSLLVEHTMERLSEHSLLKAPVATTTDPVLLVAAALDFRNRELIFLHGLPTADKHRLVPRWDEADPFPAHHLLFSGYVTLVLLGAKPCTVFGNGRWPGFSAAFFAAVVEPWATAHSISSYHFRLERITSALIPTEVPGHPGFLGWHLLLNTHDAAAPHAASVLLSGSRAVSNADVGSALGYPGSEGHATSAGVFYMAADDVPYRDPSYPGEPICCVPLVEFRASRDDAGAVGSHFRRSADAVAAWPALCLRLSLDLQECQSWGPAALAALFTAAFKDKAGLLAAIEARELRMWPWLASGVLQQAVRLMAA